jgi:hypothetical protein
VVRIVKGRILLTGIFISKGRKSMLEERILHILNLRGGMKMNRKLAVVCVVFVLALLLIFGSCATGGRAYNRDFRQELVGTWINEEYNNPPHAWAKIVITSNKREIFYPHAGVEDFVEGPLDIEDRWTDSEKNVYYKTHWTHPSMSMYSLIKLSSGGNVLEVVWNWIDEYPSEIDQNDPGYFIYYRQ